MVVHLAESTGKVKLVGKTKLFADLLDGEIRGVQELYSLLHAQMV
jgi:hypothetical protein